MYDQAWQNRVNKFTALFSQRIAWTNVDEIYSLE